MIDFCQIRDVQKALTTLEESFKAEHGIGINEGAILCKLDNCCLTSSEISKCSDLKASHASKTIKVLEEKKLIERQICDNDKRVMKFVLSKEGKIRLKAMRESNVEIPHSLKSIIEN